MHRSGYLGTSGLGVGLWQAFKQAFRFCFLRSLVFLYVLLSLTTICTLVHPEIFSSRLASLPHSDPYSYCPLDIEQNLLKPGGPN